MGPRERAEGGVQAHYTIMQLQVETEQPAAWLKEVLQGVANQHKRGPLNGQWELKREYQYGGSASAPSHGAT